MNILYTDVLIIGGGLAGLRLGIAARRRGHDVLVLSLVPPKRSHSAAAQGGMQASLANQQTQMAAQQLNQQANLQAALANQGANL